MISDRSESDHYKYPLCSLSLKVVGNFPLGVTETPTERGEQNEMRTFWAWTQSAYCNFKFCPVVVCVIIQSCKVLNMRHIYCDAN